MAGILPCITVYNIAQPPGSTTIYLASRREDVFHVYYRAYETTVKDEKARLEGFLDRYPGYNWLIAPKLKLLD